MLLSFFLQPGWLLLAAALAYLVYLALAGLIFLVALLRAPSHQQAANVTAKFFPPTSYLS